jgi:hypothetical protein
MLNFRHSSIDVNTEIIYTKKVINFKNMNQEIKDKIISAVKEDKIKLDILAKKLFISERQLKLLLNEWKVEIPGKRKIVERPEREELMNVYSQGKNISDVAKHYSVNINTVAKWMKDLSLPTKKLVMTLEEKKELLEKHLSLLKNIDL